MGFDAEAGGLVRRACPRSPRGRGLYSPSNLGEGDHWREASGGGTISPEVFLEILPGVAEVGPRFLQGSVRVVARGEAEDGLDLGDGQYVAAVGVAHEGFQGVPGQVLPAALQALPHFVRNL